METKKVKFDDNNKLTLIRDYEMFEYEFISEDNGFLVFKKSDKYLNNKKLNKLEKSYFKLTTIPFWSLLLTLSITFIFFTLFLIFGIFTKNIIDINVTYFVFLLPGVLSFILLAILAILFSLDINKQINYPNYKYEKYIKIIKEVKHGGK